VDAFNSPAKIKPIKNNRDHGEALKEIDRLMDARPNTPEGDRLDVLVPLVEAWEEKHWPIDSRTANRSLPRS
jgi:HTH-type transcriptional regulator/antitoxin HigA